MNAWRIVIEVPLGENRLDELLDTILNVVYDWQPEDRDWDAGISAHAYQDDFFPNLNVDPNPNKM
jgi:hypothetical protein